jgi:hypothetical protein
VGTAKPFASTDGLVTTDDVGVLIGAEAVPLGAAAVPLGAVAAVRLPSLELAQALNASPMTTVTTSGDVVLATRRSIMHRLCHR